MLEQEGRNIGSYIWSLSLIELELALYPTSPDAIPGDLAMALPLGSPQNQVDIKYLIAETILGSSET